jgi:phosphoenolpyruvate synthase/pyruvate phosphate dikinase
MTRVSSESVASTMYSDLPETGGETVRATLRGRAASPGIATGRCKVLTSVEDASVPDEGTVLVYRIASLDLIRLIPEAKALITERGGALATACIYAREYGIPTVVGVSGILETIKDGDIVRVDGSNGTVDLLE